MINFLCFESLFLTMFENMDILKDEHFQQFIQNRQIKDSSVRIYRNDIKKFCNYVELSPTELILEAEDEEDERIRMKNRKIKKHLIVFIQKLKDEEIPYLNERLNLFRKLLRDKEFLNKLK